jgi:hypothetical protein
MFGILIARHGWRVTFLGSDTPVDTLADSIGRLRPSLAVLATVDAERFHANRDAIRELAATVPTAVAAPVDESDVVATGARPLVADILLAARSLVVPRPRQGRARARQA